MGERRAARLRLLRDVEHSSGDRGVGERIIALDWSVTQSRQSVSDSRMLVDAARACLTVPLFPVGRRDLPMRMRTGSELAHSEHDHTHKLGRDREKPPSMHDRIEGEEMAVCA